MRGIFFWKEPSGQAAAEYVLLLALVAACGLSVLACKDPLLRYLRALAEVVTKTR